VPWGLYRFHQSRLPHFITFTCYRRQSFLNTPTRLDAFLQVLERTRLRYQFFIYGFVVMPNHIHLLISEPGHGTIATVIQSLKIASAKRAKPQDSPFWQRRYYDRNVRDHEEFIQELKYVHRNPMKRGLVAQPEDWLWSSYRHYALDEQGIVAVESPWAAYKPQTPLSRRESTVPHLCEGWVTRSAIPNLGHSGYFRSQPLLFFLPLPLSSIYNQFVGRRIRVPNLAPSARSNCSLTSLSWHGDEYDLYEKYGKYDLHDKYDKIAAQNLQFLQLTATAGIRYI